MLDGEATYDDICAEIGNTAPPFDTREQCRRFIRAATLFLAQPSEQTGSTGGTRFEPKWIAEQLNDAKVQLAVFGTPENVAAAQPSRIVRVSLRNFR